MSEPKLISFSASHESRAGSPSGRFRLFLALVVIHALAGPLRLAADPPVTVFPDGGEAALTIYHDGGAVVRRKGEVALPAGEAVLEFPGMPAGTDPASALLRRADTGAPLAILGREFLPPLADPRAILEAQIGGEVEVVNHAPGRAPDSVHVRTGRLLSAGDPPVIQFPEGIEIGPQGTIRVARPVSSPRAHAAMRWHVRSAGAGAAPLEHIFATEGIGWRAGYSAAVSASGDRADLTGWLRIANNTPMAFRDARVELVEGEMPVARGAESSARGRAAIPAPAPGPEAADAEEPVRARRYTPGLPLTVGPNATARMALFHAPDLPVTRHCVLESWPYLNTGVMPTGRPRPLEDRLRLVNREGEGPGVALPGGPLGVYETDADGGVRYTTGDNLPHTPVGAAFEIVLGPSADVTADRVLTSRRGTARTGPMFEASFLVTLRNHGAARVSARVVEHFSGDWSVSAESHTSSRPDPGTLVYELDLPPGAEIPVSFTVQSGPAMVGPGAGASGAVAPGGGRP